MATTNEMKIMNTRVAMKTDVSSNWESSTKQLLKGEIAFCRLSGDLSDMYEMRIGVGDKTWKELSGSNIRIPASSVAGLEEAIASLSTSFYREAAFEDLPTTGVTNGSIAVVEKTINAEKKIVERTAYVWNSANPEANKWEALDGNYSAENVYFKDDITLAGDYSAVGNIKLSDGELPAAGKSVKTLMDNIFTKELYPSKTLPSYTFTSIGSQGLKEVGDTYAVPGATFTYTGTGSYTYDPKDAACKVSANSVTIARTTSGEEATKTNSAEIVKNGTLALDNGSAGVTFLDYESRKTYSFTCTASHSEGVMPKTNLGNDYPTARISATDGWSSGPTTASATYYGYRNFWIGSVADGTTAIDETFVKKNLKAVKSAAKNFQVTSAGSSSTSGYERIELVAGAKRIILVLPAAGNYKRARKQVLLKSASNTPITDSYVSIGQIDVSGKVAGQNQMKYNVYVYQPAAIGAGEVHDIQIG